MGSRLDKCFRFLRNGAHRFEQRWIVQNVQIRLIAFDIKILVKALKISVSKFCRRVGGDSVMKSKIRDRIAQS